MAAADKDAATAGAQSVRRALAVLRVLATGQERGVRLTDVAAHTGLNRPTVHRILRVLVEESAVEQDLATRRYLIGGEVSLLGLARSARFPIRAIAEPHLRHLSESLGGTTFLTIRNGVDSVCIDRRPGSFSVKVLSIESGAGRPLGVGVSGLVLLASLQPEEAAEVVRRNARRLQALHIDPAELLERALRRRRTSTRPNCSNARCARARRDMPTRRSAWCPARARWPCRCAWRTAAPSPGWPARPSPSDCRLSACPWWSHR